MYKKEDFQLMPSPLKPPEFCSLVPSATSSLCDRLSRVFLRMPQMLCDFFTWAFNADGTLSDDFKNEAQIIPTGTVIARLSTVVPTGWLKCDGTEISRETYALLFAVIGTTYGAGNGTTTFNLPNLQDKFLYGKSSTNNVGDSGGESEHLLTTPELPAHSHPPAADVGYFATFKADFSADNLGNEGVTNEANQQLVGSRQATGNTGQNVPHNNLPPFMRVTWLIHI